MKLTLIYHRNISTEEIQTKTMIHKVKMIQKIKHYKMNLDQKTKKVK